LRQFRDCIVLDSVCGEFGIMRERSLVRVDLADDLINDVRIR
jgi:hypothetical protein